MPDRHRPGYMKEYNETNKEKMREYNANRAEQMKEYTKEKYKQFGIRFSYESDDDILQHLDSLDEAFASYIKRLIRADIAAHQEQ